MATVIHKIPLQLVNGVEVKLPDYFTVLSLEMLPVSEKTILNSAELEALQKGFTFVEPVLLIAHEKDAVFLPHKILLYAAKEEIPYSLNQVKFLATYFYTQPTGKPLLGFFFSLKLHDDATL